MAPGARSGQDTLCADGGSLPYIVRSCVELSALDGTPGPWSSVQLPWEAVLRQKEHSGASFEIETWL